jgi:hypothetical protein
VEKRRLRVRLWKKKAKTGGKKAKTVAKRRLRQR